MTAQWRLFLLALRYFTRIPVPATRKRLPFEARWPGDFFGAAQQLTEVAIYLGALAAWTYI